MGQWTGDGVPYFSKDTGYGWASNIHRFKSMTSPSSIKEAIKKKVMKRPKETEKRQILAFTNIYGNFPMLKCCYHSGELSR